MKKNEYICGHINQLLYLRKKPNKFQFTANLPHCKEIKRTKKRQNNKKNKNKLKTSPNYKLEILNETKIAIFPKKGKNKSSSLYVIIPIYEISKTDF